MALEILQRQQGLNNVLKWRFLFSRGISVESIVAALEALRLGNARQEHQCRYGRIHLFIRFDLIHDLMNGHSLSSHELGEGKVSLVPDNLIFFTCLEIEHLSCDYLGACVVV